jgi:hypothetical protein
MPSGPCSPGPAYNPDYPALHRSPGVTFGGVPPEFPKDEEPGPPYYKLPSTLGGPKWSMKAPESEIQYMLV